MKGMKRSMFVTTILMVVLLIVALSTATFAWYTAQSNATVTKTQIVAANSSSASLVIDDHAALSNTDSQSSVTIAMTQGIHPMMIDMSAAPIVGTTTYTNFKTDFVNFTVTNAGKFASVPTSDYAASIITAVTGSGSAQTQDNFYVTNVGGLNAGIEATVTIDDEVYALKHTGTAEDTTNVDGLYTLSAGVYTAVSGTGNIAENGVEYYAKISNNYLRVAMFVDGKYVGTWAVSGQNTVKYADYTGADSAVKEVGDDPLTTSTYTATVSGTAVNVKASLASMTAINVQLVSWFEGDNMTNAYAGTGANFTITFNAVAAA